MYAGSWIKCIIAIRTRKRYARVRLEGIFSVSIALSLPHTGFKSARRSVPRDDGEGGWTGFHSSEETNHCVNCGEP